jgi:hypothetical protein
MRLILLIMAVMTLSIDSFAKGVKSPKPPSEGVKPPSSSGGTSSSLDPQSFSAPAGSIIYNARSAIIESSYRISTGDANSMATSP